ncbi:TPR end-of-group domain-containing protein [Proteiniphilum sp.]|uniref:TPR end-of-group domain-containing protein n=1 Tax=Proteiniphilum sp. TaxID=1926877 RepID=UPI002B215286|nr:transglutaminase domain-containing protein [Proteiniphilum sp.]MEA4916337.1 transglutaminase domain-containing protein [Proteiniphilum sp.]
MKKIFILFVIIIGGSFTTFGQTGSPIFDNFISKLDSIQKQYSQYYDKGEYKKTEASLREMLKLTDNLELPAEDMTKYKISLASIKANTYYNLACTYSLLNKKKEAVNAFEKAIEASYSEYRHAKADADLDNIRKEKKFIALLNQIKQFDKLFILQNSNKYQKENTDSLPQFTYQSTDNRNLKEVRTFFNLDSVAGNGDEVSKIINILNFAHNTIKHNGNNFALCEFDAIDIYNYNKSTGKGVNCRHLAIALNEMYLSMGFSSRYVTCMPKNPDDPDCHVINTVYSTQLQKWVWVDPTFNAYVKDENGNLLSIAEVRECLIANKPLVLNEDANWNNISKQTKEYYLDNYMAKNLYWIQCIDYSRFNPESRYRKNENKYIALLPVGFEFDLPDGIITPKYVTHDPDYFWQAPQNNN